MADISGRYKTLQSYQCQQMLTFLNKIEVVVKINPTDCITPRDCGVFIVRRIRKNIYCLQYQQYLHLSNLLSFCFVKEKAASGLAYLVNACLDRNPCPNAKIVRNLVMCLCCDARYTPSASEPLSFSQESSGAGNFSDSEGTQPRSSSPSALEIKTLCTKHSGILTFAKQQQVIWWHKIKPCYRCLCVWFIQVYVTFMFVLQYRYYM